MSDGIFHGYDEVLRHRDDVLQRLGRAVEAMDPDRLARHPPGGGWSVPDTLEHLAVVAESILAISSKLLVRAASAGVPAAPLAVDLSAWVRAYTTERIRTRAPFEPAGGRDPRESLARLHSVQSTLRALSGRVAAVDPASVSFRHWQFGPLSLGEWLAFLGLHEERHLARPPFSSA